MVDRDMVATLGLTQQDVGAALGAALGGGYVNYFSIAGRSYKVIPQVLQADRLNPSQVLDYYLRTPDGSLMPASTVAHMKTEVVPESINHFQQLNSATISGVFGRRVAEARCCDFLREHARRGRAQGYAVDYAGPSRQFMQESGGFVVDAAASRSIIVFLALAAQFESFRDPVVILVSVPMALFGALIFINPRLRHAQHLHAGRPGDADGPDQQARHPDRAVRQRAAAAPARPSARRSRRPPRCACARS